MAHFRFLVIQAHCGIEPRDGSRVGVSPAIHVGTAGVAVQLLPAAVVLCVSRSRGNPAKNEFSIFSLTGTGICHS